MTFISVYIYIYIQDGLTPIHIASQKGYSEIVEMLLKANTWIDLTNKVSYLLYNLTGSLLR